MPGTAVSGNQLDQLDTQGCIFDDLSVAYFDFENSATFAPQHADPVSDDEAGRFLCFSHLIRIVHAKDASSNGEWNVDFEEKCGLHVLTLFVFPSTLHQGGGTANTSLNADQLNAARDFMFLALPHDSIKYPRKQDGGTPGDPASVLITVPRGDNTEADAMAVVLTYVSWVSRGHVRLVLQAIKRSVHSVGVEWRDAFEGGDGRGLVELQGLVDRWEVEEREARDEEMRKMERKGGKGRETL